MTTGTQRTARSKLVDVIVGNTTALMAIPQTIYRRVMAHDPKVVGQQNGVYVSPGFGLYASAEDFRMFTED